MKLFGFAGLAVALTAALVAPAAGQDGPVEIKPGFPKVGDRVKTVVTEKTETKTTPAGGKAKVESKVVSMTFTDEIVTAAAGKRPTKLNRTYDKTSASTNGGKAAALPVQGKTVLIEKKLNKYAFTIDGKAVDEAVQTMLDEEFNTVGQNPLLMAPTKAKMGDGWEIDRAKIVTALGSKDLQLDKTKAEGTGKFPLVEMRGERRFGKVQLEANAAVTSLGEKSTLQLKSGKYTYTYKNEFCIDGLSPQADLSITTKLEVSGTQDGQEVTVVTTASEDRKVTVLRPDKKK